MDLFELADQIDAFISPSSATKGMQYQWIGFFLSQSGLDPRKHSLINGTVDVSLAV